MTSGPPFLLEYVSEDRLMRRRLVFFSLALFLTLGIAWLMTHVLSYNTFSGFDYLLLPVFFLLTLVICVGFCQALIGFFLWLRGGDSQRLTRLLSTQNPPLLASTAIVMPIFNEDVEAVFQAMSQMYKAMQQTGHLEHFDFFVLSDSSDPNKWIEEEVAWVSVCKKLEAFGRFFYRKRRRAINRKSGNLGDFCRRWGKRYRYMIVLDADSLMSASTMVELVNLMERGPDIGIIQTMPRLIQSETLFARMLQFTVRLYAPLFAAGLNYWQQGEANYWGHNAIIRLAPFIKYCALPELPGIEPLGGRILSHDYIEAALMKKAGFGVWLAYEMEGSYEQSPPTLIDYAKRDRRWMQGNLQHSWFVGARGLGFLSRLHLLMGILSYVASPLWFAFIVLSILQTYQEIGFAAYSGERSAFLQFTEQIFDAPQSLILFSSVLSMLFIPKFLCLWTVFVKKEEARLFGGRWRLLGSVVVENLLSVLLAPIHMLFISKFLLFTIIGKKVGWSTQTRAAQGTSLREALSAHGGQTFLGLALTFFMAYYSPALLISFAPILAGLLLSIPLSMWLSRSSWGGRLKRMGIFLTPEEVSAPEEILALQSENQSNKRLLQDPHNLCALCYPYADQQKMKPWQMYQPWLLVVIDPYLHALHLLLLRRRKVAKAGEKKLPRHLAGICEKFLTEGPQSLNASERINILYDASTLDFLYRTFWSRSYLPLEEEKNKA